MFTIGQTVLLGDLRGKVRKIRDNQVWVDFRGFPEIVDMDELKPLPRKPQKRRETFIPIGSKIITVDDVKRWQAMEARLEEAIAEAKRVLLADELKENLMDTLRYIKDGNYE